MSDLYDSGILNDFGGGNVQWWQDYIRAEVNRCNDFHSEIINQLREENERLRNIEDKVRAYLNVKKSWDNQLRELASITRAFRLKSLEEK